MELKPVSCRVPELIQRLGKTQQWLADQTGMSKQQLSNYISMSSLMGIVNAKKIAEALRVKIDDLYVWERQRE